MATTLICDMKDCKRRSKRKLTTWLKKGCEPCYGCSRPYTLLRHVFEPDGDIETAAGKENMAACAYYEPIDAEEGG